MNRVMSVMGFVVAVGLIQSCGSKSNDKTGTAGTTGAAGTGAAGTATAGTAVGGTTGAAGTHVDAGATDAVFAIDGHCSIAGQTPRAGGICMCSAGSPVVCGTACTDTQNDNDHCGTCDTKCGATSVCVAGHCGAMPTPFVPAAAGCGTIHLALSGGTLYWTDSGHGTVKSIATTVGATAVSIATAQMAPTLIGVYANIVFWLDSGSKTIMKAGVPGGTPTVVTTSATDAINGFTVSPDGGTVYFAAGKHILKVSAAGGAATNIDDQDDGIPGNLALEGTTLVFGSDQAQDVDAIYLADGKVSQCGMKNDAGNGFCTMGLRIGRSQGSLLLDTIYLVGGKIYWARGTDIVVADSMMTAGADASGKEVKITSTGNFNNVSAFTIVGTTAYLTEDGYVEKAALVPSDVEAKLLVRGQKAPTSIVADANNVYWANGDCAIMTIPAK